MLTYFRLNIQIKIYTSEMTVETRAVEPEPEQKYLAPASGIYIFWLWLQNDLVD